MMRKGYDHVTKRIIDRPADDLHAEATRHANDAQSDIP